jgi:hypothetical protein
VDQGNRGGIHPCIAVVSAVSQQVLAILHRLCGAESVAVSFHQVVPHGRHPYEAGHRGTIELMSSPGNRGQNQINAPYAKFHPADLRRKVKNVLKKGGAMTFTTLVRNNRIADRYVKVWEKAGEVISRDIAEIQAAFDQLGMVTQ